MVNREISEVLKVNTIFEQKNKNRLLKMEIYILTSEIN